MPYAGVPAADTDKLDSCVQKLMAQGHDKSSAIAICRSSMNMSDDKRELYAFEPFGSMEGILAGLPVKIMPVGTFYRDSRKLTITPERLQEFAANVKAGLPRFRIPINENHGGIGKVGTVTDIAYMPLGPDGDGLYATAYELTEQGKALVTSKRFDAVSPEAVWTLNDGATYQDPQTGKKHDNVLVGLALTDRPFFGHDNVALFSATPEEFRHNGYTKLKANLKVKFDEMMAMIADHEPDPDDKNEPGEPKEKAAVAAKGAETMTDAEKAAADKLAADKLKVEAEKFSVTAEEFAALKAKAGEVDKMSAMLGEMKRARRVDQLTAHAKETFVYLPVKSEDLAEKFAALEEHDPKLFEYFDGLLATMDRQVNAGGLFSQIGSGMPGTNGPDSFDALIEKTLTDKFGGDRSKYAEAMSAARKARPDLFAEYSDTYSVPEHKKS